MKILILKAFIIALQLFTLWHLRRAIRRNAILHMVKIYRSAYRYAKWVDDRTTGTKVVLTTETCVLRYDRPVTMAKIVEAYRDSR